MTDILQRNEKKLDAVQHSFHLNFAVVNMLIRKCALSPFSNSYSEISKVVYEMKLLIGRPYHLNYRTCLNHSVSLSRFFNLTYNLTATVPSLPPAALQISCVLTLGYLLKKKE